MKMRSLEMVIEALEEVLERTTGNTVAVTPETRLDSLSLDSLEVAELFVRLEELCGVFVDADSIERFEVVGDLAQLLPGGGDGGMR
jgi:acyl carrier protein